MEWSIHQIAQFGGVTSRTLRHYDHVGLLPPSRTGANGYRYYGQDAVLRLQRILLLRDVGLSLTEIAEVLDNARDEVAALRSHVDLLQAERERLDRKISTVQQTIAAIESNETVSLDEAFNGFNDDFQDEVIARWGQRVFDDSNRWWHSKSEGEQSDWKRSVEQLNADWTAAWNDHEEPTSSRAQDLAQRHVDWLGGIPGTPVADGDPVRSGQLLLYLGDLYVADARIAAHYGGPEGAVFVRAALAEYARQHFASNY